MLDEKFQWNASKFVIFYTYVQKPIVAFSIPFFISYRPGHSVGKKNKVAQNEKRKKQLWFSYIQNMANFEAFRWRFSSSINLFFWRYFIWTSLKNAWRVLGKISMMGICLRISKIILKVTLFVSLWEVHYQTLHLISM